MKNQGNKHIFSPQDSANSPASISGVNRSSPAKGSIKIVAPPAIPRRIISDNLSPYHAPNRNANCLDDPRLFYDGNNYYSTKTSMIQQQHHHQPVFHDSADPNIQNHCSYQDGKNNEPVKGLLTLNRVSIQSYESIASTSSNKDSDSSQQSSISSSSTSSSFCSSSSSSSSSSFPQQNNSTQTLSPCSSTGASFASANNVFKLKPNPNKMKDNLIARAGPLTIAEMLLHGVSDSEMIHVWLQKINLNKYEKNFIDAAYDMSTIARMNPQDLIAIGITDPQARSILTAEIQKLKIPDNLPSTKPSSLEEWLKMINLDCYHDCLCQQGYKTIDRVTELTWEDLEDVGINKLGHQKKILLAIKKIKSSKTSDAENFQNYSTISPMPENIYSTGKSNNFDPTIQPVHVETQNQSNQTQPYQDVMIKMYANANLNSPNHPDVNQKEICLIDNRRHILPSPLIDQKSRMHTFQQQQQQQQQQNLLNPPMLLPPPPTSLVDDQFNYSRRRSLESLNTNENMNYCSSFSNFNVQTNQQNFCRPPYHQYSNCDLTNNNNGINRQTICFENQSLMNTFVTDPNHSDYEPNAISTLNRPKILMKTKFNSPMLPIARHDSMCSPLVHSNDVKLNFSTSDVYASFKKKPPPPPRRSNSIREPNSMPSTPVHRFHPDSNHINQSNRFGLIDDHVLPSQISLKNEDIFASCVNSLTRKFSETRSSFKNDMFDDKSSPKMNNLKQSHTVPPNNSKEVWNENNISSSSSGESMYFAHDNVGTIRQKANSFQKIPNTDFNHKSSSSSSTTPSTPGSDTNVLTSFSNATKINDSKLTIDSRQSAPMFSSNDSSQNIVDSLEHIEMMLATLKTQLDSID